MGERFGLPKRLHDTGAGTAPTRVHVAHRGLFVVAVDVQHLLVCGLRLQLLHLLSSFLERGLGGRRQRVSEGKVPGAPQLPPETPSSPRSPPAPPGPPQPRCPPHLGHRDEHSVVPTPTASASPPSPFARLTPRQTNRRPIAAPRAPQAPISAGQGRVQGGQGANAEEVRVPPIHQGMRRQGRCGGGTEPSQPILSLRGGTERTRLAERVGGAGPGSGGGER